MADMDRYGVDDGDDLRDVFQAPLLSDLEIIDTGFCEESEIEISNFEYQE